MKIGFIGGGNMADAMIKGMTLHGMKEIFVSDPAEEKRRHLKDRYGVETTSSNTEVCASCGIIILAVKPQNMEDVLNEIRDAVSAEKTVVSIAAGIRIDYILTRLNTERVIRVMPNTPALVQKGMTVISMCECLHDSDMSTIRDIFLSIGEVLTLPEKYMDAVTALSGSGPAFIALFIESMINAGVRQGLTEDNARILAVQTAVGTAYMLETGMPPSKLREMVTSPGGTTAAGLEVFNEKGLKEIVEAAAEAAVHRAKELGSSR